MRELLEVGKITNTHGLRGEVKVVTWTDYPEVFETIKHVTIKSPLKDIKLGITEVKYQKENIILKFREISNIDDAQKLKGQIILAERSELGELPDGVYYITDIIGLDVYSDDGRFLGKVSDIFSAGSSDIYAVKRTGMKDLLIPSTKETNMNIDIQGGRVTVHLIDGLEEL